METPRAERVLLLLESRPRKRVSVDDIEAKLKEAAIRRQQFHAWVASKAKSRRMTSAVSRRSTASLAEGDCTSSSTVKGTVNSYASTDPEAMLQRLYSKLEAAAKKREELERQQRKRQERASRQRQQAVTEARQRLEAKAAEIEMQREGKVEKAESNRAALLEAERAKRAIARKRAAKLRVRRKEQEWRDHQRALKRLEALRARHQAAEKKRQERIDAERERAAALSVQARQVAESVLKERESDLQRKRERMEAKVAQARCRRAELLRHRGGCIGACHRHGHRKRLQWENLSKKVAKTWRAFRGSNKTSCQLAQAYLDCLITLDAQRGESFDSLAARISDPATLGAAKDLLQRLLLRLSLIPEQDVATWQRQAGNDTAAPHGTTMNRVLPKSNVDQLLAKLMPPSKRAANRRQPARVGSQPPNVSSVVKCASNLTNQAANAPGTSPVSRPSPARPGPSEADVVSPERYPVRPFLSAYMVVLHPEAVMTSTSGETSQAVQAAASRLVTAFEAVVRRLAGEDSSVGAAGALNAGASGAPVAAAGATGQGDEASRKQGLVGKDRAAAPTAASRSSITRRSSETSAPTFAAKAVGQDKPLPPLRWLLLALDAEWVSFLRLFVEWKQEDQRQLEGDLIAAACRLEASMLRKCGDRPSLALSHDLQVIKEHTADDLRLLRVNIQRLTGAKGVERLDAALHDVRMQASGGASSTSTSCCGSGLSSSDMNSTSDASSVPHSPASSAACSPVQSPSSSPSRGGRGGFGTDVSSRGSRERARWRRTGAAPFSGSRGSLALPDPFVPLRQGERETASAAQVVSGGQLLEETKDQAEGVGAGRGEQGDVILPEVVAQVLQDRLHRAVAETVAGVGSGVGSPADVASVQHPLEAQVSGAMKAAFWSTLRESLLSSPPDMSKAESLLREWHAEMLSISPKSQPAFAQELEASLERSLCALQALGKELAGESGTQGQGQAGAELLSLLEGAAGVLLSLGAAAREGATRQGLEDLKQRLQGVGGEGTGLAQGLVDGLAFLFEHLMVLKKDLAVAPLMLIPMPEVVQMLRTSFAALHAICPYPSATADATVAEDLKTKLPRTWAWLEQHCTESPVPAGASEVTVEMRAGRGTVNCVYNVNRAAGELTLPTGVMRGVRAGLLRLVAQAEGVEAASVAETLNLDSQRIRVCQERFQRIVVAATGLLLVRQAVTAAGLPASSSLDSALEDSLPRLKEALAGAAVGAKTLGELLGGMAEGIANSSGTVQQGNTSTDFVSIISSLLPKALDPTAVIFRRVSGAVVEAMQLLLDGEGNSMDGSSGGDKVASVQICLKRGGAALLLQDVVELGKTVDALSRVLVRVHGPVYRVMMG